MDNIAIDSKLPGWAKKILDIEKLIIEEKNIENDNDIELQQAVATECVVSKKKGDDA